jgi:hypothetical protein
MTKTVLLSIFGGVAFLALFGACLFVSAGRWDLPWFWAYLGVWAVAIVAGSFLIDPTLVRERIRPGPGGKEGLAQEEYLREETHGCPPGPFCA